MEDEVSGVRERAGGGEGDDERRGGARADGKARLMGAGWEYQPEGTAITPLGDMTHPRSRTKVA